MLRLALSYSTTLSLFFFDQWRNHWKEKRKCGRIVEGERCLESSPQQINGEVSIRESVVYVEYIVEG